MTSRLTDTTRSGMAIVSVLVTERTVSKWAAAATDAWVRSAINHLTPYVEVRILEALEEHAERFDELHEPNSEIRLFLNVRYTLRSSAEPSADVTDRDLQLELAELAFSPIDEGIEPLPSRRWWGTATQNQRHSMSERMSIGDLYGDPSRGGRG